MAAKAYLEQSGKTGTLVFFGCPAEEQGFGKGFMAKARCFDGVDMMFTWHPADQNVPMGTRMVANYKVRFDFTGISAHAGAAPEKGRSALDACELMNVGVNYMREHVPIWTTAAKLPMWSRTMPPCCILCALRSWPRAARSWPGSKRSPRERLL